MYHSGSSLNGTCAGEACLGLSGLCSPSSRRVPFPNTTSCPVSLPPAGCKLRETRLSSPLQPQGLRQGVAHETREFRVC